MYDRYGEPTHYEMTQDGAVARLRFKAPGEKAPSAAEVESHWELAELLWRIAFDESIRVLVLCGQGDGTFLAPPGGVAEPGRIVGPQRRSAHWLWRVSTGIVRAHYALALLDKPVVAQVDGDAIGIGSVFMLAADVVVAHEDARVVDNHLGMGEIDPWHWQIGVVPGDGGIALAARAFPSPARAKEFLMLAREYSAKQLADLGVINWALPLAEVAPKVDEIVDALLRRSAYALAWTKRLSSKPLLDELNRSLDAGIAYELINMMQFAEEGVDQLEL